MYCTREVREAMATHSVAVVAVVAPEGQQATEASAQLLTIAQLHRAGQAGHRAAEQEGLVGSDWPGVLFAGHMSEGAGWWI